MKQKGLILSQPGNGPLFINLPVHPASHSKLGL